MRSGMQEGSQWWPPPRGAHTTSYGLRFGVRTAHSRSAARVGCPAAAAKESARDTVGLQAAEWGMRPAPLQPAIRHACRQQAVAQAERAACGPSQSSQQLSEVHAARARPATPPHLEVRGAEPAAGDDLGGVPAGRGGAPDEVAQQPLRVPVRNLRRGGGEERRVGMGRAGCCGCGGKGAAPGKCSFSDEPRWAEQAVAVRHRRRRGAPPTCPSTLRSPSLGSSLWPISICSTSASLASAGGQGEGRAAGR